MAETARVRFHLDSGDAELKLGRFAMDSAVVSSTYRQLPRDLQLAHREMLRLGSAHVRMGHLRHQERQRLGLYQQRQAQHVERVSRTIQSLQSSTAAHPAAAQYAELLKGGPGGLRSALRSNPMLADLHAQTTSLGDARAQMAAIHAQRDHLGKYGVTSEFNARNSASYWGRRAMWGGRPDGTPRTGREWAKEGAASTLGRVHRGARQVAGLFTVFQGMNMLNRSMNAFEQKAITIQEIGSKLGVSIEGVGDAFGYVEEQLSGKKVSGRAAWRAGVPGGKTAWVGGVRKEYGYRLSQIAPGMRQLVRHAGSLDLLDPALRLARATGMDPNATQSAYGRQSMYGQVDHDLLERSINYSGMSNRPEVALQWLTGTQQQLGSGYLRVPGGTAARYMGFVSGAMGSAFQNQRGADLTGRLIGGMRTPGQGALYAAKMHAVRGLGKLDIGGGRSIDTSTYRGMRAALESGDPRVLEALFGEAKRLGGNGELGREMFQSLLGNRVNIFESDMLFEAMGKSGGQVTRADAIRMAPNLDKNLAAVRNKRNPAWNIQSTGARMEVDVYERVGAVLRPITVDFQKAALKLADRMAESADGFELASNMLAGIGEAITYLRSDATPGAHLVFEFSLASGSQSAASFLLKQAAAAGAQAMGAANKP